MAVRCYTAALKRDPDNAFALMERGLSRDRLGNDDEGALRDLEAAWKLDPQPQTRLAMGDVLYRLDRAREAVQCYTEVLEQDPDDRAARLHRAATYLSLNDLPHADEDIERARAQLAERGGAPDEVASAAKLVVQAMRRYARLDPRQQRQRLYALLARHGYGSDTIRRALEVNDPLESGQDA